MSTDMMTEKGNKKAAAGGAAAVLPPPKPQASRMYLNVDALQDLADSIPIKLRAVDGEKILDLKFSIHPAALQAISNDVRDKIYDMAAYWEGQRRTGRLDVTDPKAYELGRPG